MRQRQWMTLGALSISAFSLSMLVKSFLPRNFDPGAVQWQEDGEKSAASSALPAIDVSILRCGSITIPTFLAVRGAFSFTPCVIAHSAVLVRHPKATFLYDTGLCGDIALLLRDQPFFFRKTLGNFRFEHSLESHLQRMGLAPKDLDFALLSHLHWDHVSGVPDIPGVPLRVSRLEYEAAHQGRIDLHHGLIWQLMGENPVELFDCTDRAYEGFRAHLDLFGDGSIILVPLPGHTPGQIGMFVNRSNGSRLFLIADAGWMAANYRRPATMHPFFWKRVTSDDGAACRTLLELHRFSRQHPEVPLIPMHDAQMQQEFMQSHGPRFENRSL